MFSWQATIMGPVSIPLSLAVVVCATGQVCKLFFERDDELSRGNGGGARSCRSILLCLVHFWDGWL